MATRKTSLRSKKFDKNITKRGTSAVSTKKVEADGPTINPYLVIFFLVILVGSSVFQVIRMAQSGPVF